MSSFNELIEKNVIELLRKERKPLTTDFICNKLNISKSSASFILYNLMKKGIVKRVYTESYDPTRPFDTAAWVLEHQEITDKDHVNLTEDASRKMKFINTKLVLSVPLSMISLRKKLLNKYEALDFHDAYSHIIEIARNELKIMCPIIDAYALYPLITKMLSSDIFKVKILTEISKSKDIIYLLKSLNNNNIEIKNVEKRIKYEELERKSFGIHAKLIIADDQIALIGSFNLSRHHYLINFDIGFLVYEPEIVKMLSEMFDELWNHVIPHD